MIVIAVGLQVFFLICLLMWYKTLKPSLFSDSKFICIDQFGKHKTRETQF